MPKIQITPEERLAEAARLRAIFEAAQDRENGLTQESLADEMKVSQGLIHQWLSGKKTPIPDKRLLWLSRRFNFNPLDVRKSMAVNADLIVTEQEREVMRAYLTNPDFRKIVDTIAASAGYLDSSP